MTGNLELPSEVINRYKPVDIRRVRLGESGDMVARVACDDGSGIYVKIARGEGMDVLREEVGLLRWLQGRCGSPRVEWFADGVESVIVCLTEVPGQPASELVGHRSDLDLLGALARGLRSLHDVPIASCPNWRQLEQTTREAQIRAEAGRVRLDDLDSIRSGWSLSDLLEVLSATRPATEDLVLTHGDYCLPNILIADNEVAGLVDWGRGGVADRYQDIALLLRSFEYNGGDLARDPFCKAYGLESLDTERVQFYQLLDEFF